MVFDEFLTIISSLLLTFLFIIVIIIVIIIHFRSTMSKHQRRKGNAKVGNLHVVYVYLIIDKILTFFS